MARADFKKSAFFRFLYNCLVTASLFSKNILARIKKKVVGESVVAFLVQTKQGNFLVDPLDQGVGGTLIKHGSYGAEEIERIHSLTDSSSNVLFVGTHIGSLAIPVSKHVRHLTAIEANPKTYKLLTMNALLNGCANLNPIQIAASDQKGQLEFVLSKTNSGGSKRKPVIKSYKYYYDSPEIVKVDADSLDSILQESYDLIVMDIEGSEYFGLRGMTRILTSACHLIVEFIPHHLKNVSCVSVREFLSAIDPYFDSLYIPSKGLIVEKSKMTSVLEGMYQRDESDDALIFSKDTDLALRMCPTAGLNIARNP